VVQEVTLDEEQGLAEQLALPLVLAEETQQRMFAARALRDELDLVPADELAEALGLAEQTLAAWRSEKQGPDYVKLGKTVFYRRCGLTEWIARRSTAASVGG
jgi:predicted DNA-binding transcriptional regulator AlpA